ncbi:MAG: tRNA (N6-isopentenyl adenosine(37)-C2)-methylthiotransferase MiaB [Planctomycetes bacterium]|nr:tRNA (N6-isopentenyl adenosine(37)-C2)-methylthiotransferase MiaB [Planctomycetota bacterium]
MKSKPDKPKSVFIATLGCQMNVLDSELVLGQLVAKDYVSTDSVENADVFLVNTCSVRDHAEQKALSRLGTAKKTKQQNPDMIVGVIGCMAERDPDGVFAKVPFVDLVCGPGELNKVPAMIEEVRETRKKTVALTLDKKRSSSLLDRTLDYDSVEALDLSREPAPNANVLQSYIRIQRGCDKFCTFCVVPFTRGKERSRPPQQIVDEAKMLADRGAKEITLLGQTVDSYLHQESGASVNMADLLYRLNDVDGLERIRFVTSYPGDFRDEIFHAMRDLPKVCEYLHLPAQSGSNAVLKRMKRQYSVEVYEDLVARGREIVPNITLAGDFIVGFCGETESEFNESLALMERIRFKNIFCFKYSPRPNTVADKALSDDVPDAIKRDRNRRMLKLQERISLEQTQAMIGETVEILIEGYSKAAIKAQEAEQTRGEEISWRRSDQLVGRTSTDRIVVLCGDESHIGRVVRVRISGATALTLFGDVVDDSVEAKTRGATTGGGADESALNVVRRAADGSISIPISG